MKKKTLLLGLTPFLLVAPLAGCNADDGKIHITFWQNTNKTLCSPFIVAAAERFNKDPSVNPGLKYKVDAAQQSGDYDTLAQNAIDKIASDAYCDILYGYPDAFQKLMKYGIVVNLQDYIYSEEEVEEVKVGLTQEQINDIVPVYFAEGQKYSTSGIYSMPFSKSSEVMYTSSALLNVDLSKYDPTINGGNPISRSYLNNLTWEELFEKLCPAIVAHDNDKTVIDAKKQLITPYEGKSAVFCYDSDDNFFITLAQQYGRDYTKLNGKKGEILFDNNENAEALVKLNEYYRKGYLMTGLTYGGSKKAYTSDLFNNKAALFTVSSTAGAKNTFSDLFETIPLNIPAYIDSNDVKHNDVISQGPSIAILDHGDDERTMGSWLFYKYFLEHESTMWACGTASGYLPVLQSSYETEEYQEAISIVGKEPGTLEWNLAKTYEYAGSLTRRLFDTPVFEHSASARTQCGSALAQSLLLKEADANVTNVMAILRSCVNNAKNN